MADIVVSLWVWDKSGKLLETLAHYVGDEEDRSEKVRKAMTFANNLWIKYPGKVFNKEVQIKEGFGGKKKVLKEKRNF